MNVFSLLILIVISQYTDSFYIQSISRNRQRFSLYSSPEINPINEQNDVTIDTPIKQIIADEIIERPIVAPRVTSKQTVDQIDTPADKVKLVILNFLKSTQISIVKALQASVESAKASIRRKQTEVIEDIKAVPTNIKLAAIKAKDEAARKVEKKIESTVEEVRFSKTTHYNNDLFLASSYTDQSYSLECCRLSREGQGWRDIEGAEKSRQHRQWGQFILKHHDRNEYHAYLLIVIVRYKPSPDA